MNGYKYEDMSLQINNKGNNLLLGHITQEKEYKAFNGCKTICFTIVLIILSIIFIIIGGILTELKDNILMTILSVVLLSIGIISIITAFCFFCIGYKINTPNNAYVFTYYGKYIGTLKEVGFFWVNPFYTSTSISLKYKNLNSEIIKVNDKVGNPIMMGCVIVWKVRDTAKAIFDVENYNYYVKVQTESAIRYIGCMYPYDKVNEDDICLRSGHNEINNALQKELSERLKHAGIEVVEARVTELSYASEIANVMLKRQAAEAIIAAREKIVQGAVSITGHAIDSLQINNICDLKDDEKSDLISNMLVVLCGESQVCPIVDTGH